jgi:hypothetical protein
MNWMRTVAVRDFLQGCTGKKWFPLLRLLCNARLLGLLLDAGAMITSCQAPSIIIIFCAYGAFL